MIARICILAAGVLLAAAGVLLWKKLSPAWRSALLAGGILTASIGGVFLYGFWQQRQRDREYVYLSLRYLQNSDTDSAAYYLKKVGEESTEVIIAGAKRDKEETVYEISDLAYHVLVLMVQAGITVEDITRELEQRHIIDHKVKQERMQ